MAWTAERTTINQRWQIGAESTSALGTIVASGKLLEALSFDDAIEADVQIYRGTGRKYPQTQEENKEWASAKISGNLDYNAVTYLLASCAGSNTAAAHGTSVTAKDWIFTPPLTGSIVPQTYTIERGDAIRAQRYSYAVLKKFGYKGNRKDFICDGDLIMQPIIDAITMTASPTAVPIVPMVSKHFNVYLDTTSAGLGTTLLTKVLAIDFSFDTVYDVVWFLNRATVGFSAHVDTVPKATFKMLVEADSNGMALLPAYLQAGATAYIRVQAQGSVAIAADGPGNVFNTFQHDMAVKFNKPNPFKDDQGVYAIEWVCELAEDTTWGKSQLFTVTNLLATL